MRRINMSADEAGLGAAMAVVAALVALAAMVLT
jgi:hypothetical protein